MRDAPCEHTFKLTASASASEFYNWVQVGINVCIPHCKYRIKLHSSSWFLAACAAVIVHRNHFFCLYQQNISSESKGDIRQASNCCKRVLEAAKLACATKTKESITSQKLGSQDFWQIANSVLNKGKSAKTPLFNNQEMLSSAMITQSCLLKTFLKALYMIKQNCLLKTLIFLTQVSLYPFSLLELI